MNTLEPTPKEHIPIAACEICSQLAETETSFYKYGWGDQTRPLPPAASRLAAVDAITTYDQERNHVKRCPICGVFYQYVFSYEYLVNGSEDEETLTRLTPTQARHFLTEFEYAQLIAALLADVQDADPMNRRYAAKCLVSYYLEQNESSVIESYLLHQDIEIVKGALFFLYRLADAGDQLPKLAPLASAIEALRQNGDQQVAAVAVYILGQLQ